MRGTAVAVLERTEVSTLTPEEVMAVKQTVSASLSEGSKRAYAGDWRRFEAWCRERGHVPLPAEPAVVAVYVDWRGRTKGDKFAYIQRSLSAIACFHEAAGMPNPRKSMVVHSTLMGLRRVIGVHQKQASPMVIERLRACLAHVGYPSAAATETHPLCAAQQRAMLLTSFLGALRRSELVALQLEDLEFCEEGVLLHIRKSKTDQDGRGIALPIPWARKETDLCAVTALKAWIAAAPIRDRAVFRAIRGGRVSVRAMKENHWYETLRWICRRAGLGGENLSFSTHSLRAGMVTEAYRRRVAEATVMRGSRHTDPKTMHRYIREARRWTDNVVTEMGL